MSKPVMQPENDCIAGCFISKTTAGGNAASSSCRFQVLPPPFLFYFCPLKQNITITENADLVLAFWDGLSRGTKYVIDNCKKRNIPVEIHLLNK